MNNLPMTDLEKGLSSEEVARRFERFGPNRLEAKKEFSVLGLAVGQLRSPLIYVLVAAGLATIYLGEWVDASVILLVVVINSVLGFWQEFKAAKSLEALQGFLKPRVRVIREGKHQEIELEKLVVGDVVLLDQGDSVPADGVVVEAEELGVNEALLTGESVAKVKRVPRLMNEMRGEEWRVPEVQSREAEGYVYMGTMLIAGVGKMMVVKTGNGTRMGEIAQSLSVTEEEDTPLQKRLNGLARTLMWLVVGFCGLIFGLGLLRGGELVVMFKTAIALAVAAVPEGLAVSMTVILALGMQRILKKKALVRKLVAAETLGSVSVICCDKTGTLTEGKMRIVDWKGDRDELIRGSILVSNRRDEESVAMYQWAKAELMKQKVAWTGSTSAEQISRFYRRLDMVPFSSARKYVVSLNHSKTKKVLVMAGAPEVVLKHCYMSDGKREEQRKLVEKLAGEGYRLIAVASKRVERQEIRDSMLEKLGWHGVLVFEDPIRPKVKKALEQALSAGVGVKIITGDHVVTARAVLKKILGEGFIEKKNQVLEGGELANLSQSELRRRIDKVVLFARTTPSQKLRIVEALKKRGEVVAMTGDGVNDAPALKAADIGVVVAEATDVSKQTADMVLLDSNFGTIIKAIEEGRAIFQGMRRIVTYLLGSASQEIVLIGGSMVLGLPLPLSAVQILWINLAVDGLPGVALAFDHHKGTTLDQKPIDREAPILDRQLLSVIFVIGLASNVMLVGLYYWLYRAGVDFGVLSTFMFVTIGINSLMYIFSIKDLNKNIWRIRLFDNWFLVVAVVLGVGLMTLAVYSQVLAGLLATSRIGEMEWVGVVVVCLVTIVMIEAVKWMSIRSAERKRIRLMSGGRK